MYKVPECHRSYLGVLFEAHQREELLKKNGADVRFPLSPSAAVSCGRRLYYDLQNFEEAGTVDRDDFSTRQLLVFDLGHTIESQLTEVWEKVEAVEYVKNKERFVIYDNNSLQITGEIDGILIDKGNGKKFLWDAKSISDAGFNNIKSTLTPKESNYIQLQLYLHSSMCKEQGIDTAILHYYNKNTSETLMLQFNYDEEVATQALVKLISVYRQWENGLTPARDYVLGDGWQCKQPYCAYHNVCYGKLTGSVTIDRPDLDLEKLLEEPFENRFDIFFHLTSNFGDSESYIYKPSNISIDISKLKTTIKVKVTKL